MYAHSFLDCYPYLIEEIERTITKNIRKEEGVENVRETNSPATGQKRK